MATTFRLRRLSAENTAENRDEFVLKTRKARRQKSAHALRRAIRSQRRRYLGGAGAQPAAVVKKPFVSRRRSTNYWWAPTRYPPGRRQGAAAARLAGARRCARTPNVARGAAQPGRADAAHGGDARGADACRDPGVVRVDARRGVAGREGADAQGTVADPKAPTPAAPSASPKAPTPVAGSSTIRKIELRIAPTPANRRRRRTSPLQMRPRPTRRSRAWRPSSRPRSGRRRRPRRRTSSLDPKTAATTFKRRAGGDAAEGRPLHSPANTPADRCDAVVARTALRHAELMTRLQHLGKRRGVAANPARGRGCRAGRRNALVPREPLRQARNREKVETPRADLAPWRDAAALEKAPPAGAARRPI